MKTYNPWVTIRNAAWAAAYTGAAIAIDAFAEGIQDASAMWWYPVVAAALAALGSWLRFHRKNP